MSLPKMPKMPSSARSRKSKPVVACACGGCGMTTKGTWHPGHDGHCDGWAKRVIGGTLDIAAVPDAVRAGVIKRLAFHGVSDVVAPLTQAQKKALRKAERAAAKVAVVAANVDVHDGEQVEQVAQVA